MTVHAAPNDDLTATVNGLLAGFDAGDLSREAAAWQHQLYALQFDYSPAAIARIDALLADLRQQLTTSAEDFLADRSQRGFVALLGCMIGEAVARYLGRPCRWHGSESLRARMMELGIDKAPPEGFGASLVCEIEGEGFVLPLAGVVSALFDDPPASIQRLADKWMRRVVDAEMLLDPGSLPRPSATLIADPAWALGHAMGLVANFLLTGARDGASLLNPLVLSQQGDGRGLMRSFMDVDNSEAVQRGRELLARPDDDAVCGTVLGYDGYLSLPVFRSDAIWLEGAWWHPQADAAGERPVLRARVALPYRPVDAAHALALHAIRLVAFSGDAPASRRLRAGLFTQLKEGKGATPQPWLGHFVSEDAPEILTLRARALPPMGWQRQRHPELAIELAATDLAVVRHADSLTPNEVDLARRHYGPVLGEHIALIPALLKEGRVVWGAVVQANTDLFDAGSQDQGAVIVYCAEGKAGPELLRPVSDALMALRRISAEAMPPSLAAIAAMLNAENEMVFDWPIPPALAALAGGHAALLGSLRLSIIWCLRAHLPAGRLLSDVMPLLISERYPGHVTVVPSPAWPEPLLALWRQRLEQRRRARWHAAWEELAKQRLQLRGDADQDEVDRNLGNLSSYARDGISIDRLQHLMMLDDKLFPYGSKPSPLEWEWSLDSELRSRAERLLVEVEARRARGEALLAVRAGQAFAARATAQLIGLHRHALAATRGQAEVSFLHRFESDEIQYVCLGWLAGVGPAAERMARLLIALWQRTPGYDGLLRPECWALFRLFAQHLQLGLPTQQPFEARPALDALIDAEAWRGSPEVVGPALLRACEEQISQAPLGPFLGLPLALLMILRLRQLAGLPAVEVDHALLRGARLPGGVPLDAAGSTQSVQAARSMAPLGKILDGLSDDLTQAVRKRMQAHGFDEAEIEAAVLTGRPPAPSSRLAPTRSLALASGFGRGRGRA